MLQDSGYLDLPAGTRGVLHGLWLEAMDNPQRRVRDHTSWLGRRLGLPVTRPMLERLVVSGFVELAGNEGEAK